ncbi:uncharacterized protein LOC124262049 isoform X2 [Haliotis rubra]|nr:uncharacterized protein LOC124262049 isoform X2 [Haliotis rubra]XP_046552429.1 uncharacterized protein LOC124262049 isoform X2 [Haliotis rubra]
MCYLFQATAVSHPDAEASCAESGGNIASIKDDHNAYYVTSLFTSSSDINTLWSRYLLIKHDSDAYVTSRRQNVSDCVGCNSLKPFFISQGMNESCIVTGSITSSSATWNTADCSAVHQVICEKTSVFSSLAVKDIAAIACLAFLVVSFIIVITIDLFKNPVPEDRRRILEDRNL